MLLHIFMYHIVRLGGILFIILIIVIQEILAAYPLPLLVAASYAGFGLLFALVFITFLVNLMDIHARGGSFGFRIMILPAAMLLWPLIMPITVGKVSLIVRKHLIAKKKEKEKAQREENKQEKKKAQKKEGNAALSKSKTDAPIKRATKGKDRNLLDLFPFTAVSSKVKTDKPKKTKSNKTKAVNAPKAPTKTKAAKQGVKNKAVRTEPKATKQGAKSSAGRNKSPTAKPKAVRTEHGSAPKKRNKKTTQ